MIRYIIRKIFLFLFGMIAISILAFLLNRQPTAESIKNLITESALSTGTTFSSSDTNLATKQMIQRLGYNLPLFYLSVHSLNDQSKNQRSWEKWIPLFDWHGSQNQYHIWLIGNGSNRKGIIRGDFGVSLRDGQKIGEKIGEKIKWSVSLAFSSLLLAFFVSIPAGMLAGYKRGKAFDKISGILFMGIYAIPPFFTGVFLLTLFANPDILNWFPSGGIMDPSTFNPDAPFFQRVSHHLPYLVLPVLTYSYASFAYITQQMRDSIADQMKQAYILTARAKGLSEWRILTRHALRNALFPLITIISNMLPIAFGGSLIVESIFSIPGMGHEIYHSIISQDHPVTVAVFIIFGALTLASYLLADICYAIADPRIRIETFHR